MPAGRPTDYTPISYIYALCDPCGTVRYVGKACRVSKRVAEHKRSARRRWTAKDKWLADVGDGLRVRVLKASADWEADEMMLIAHYRKVGKLFNVADGGVGGVRHERKGRGSYFKLIHGLVMCATQCRADNDPERAKAFDDMLRKHRAQRKAAIRCMSPVDYDTCLSSAIGGRL